jgi:hypothetical protein
MARKEKLEVVAKQKASTRKKILKFVAIMAAMNASIKLISMYKGKKAKKIDLPEGEYCYILKMDGKQFKFENQEVKKITLNTKMSGIDLDLSNIKNINGLRIICKGLMSGICIRVPKDIAVKVELKAKLSGLANSIPVYLDENLPIIYISGKVYFSGVDIRLVQN